MAKDRPLLETATQFPKKRTYYKILALQICCNWKMKLIRPEEFHLTSYVAALNRAIDLGTTNTERAQRKLSEIAADPESFLAKQEDPEALRQILSEPLELGMPFVELVTNPENLSSQ